jgi:ASC-1-like (ASCH) protein
MLLGFGFMVYVLVFVHLDSTGRSIKRLVRLAYPNAPVEVRDSLAYRSFRDALNDQDLEWAICQGNRDTIDEALHLGLKYEFFHNGRKKPFRRYQKVDSDTETTKLPQVPPSKTFYLYSQLKVDPHCQLLIVSLV